eukprot:XP_001697028.1 predicted protein [Chlamydomonas reinhardtii]
MSTMFVPLFLNLTCSYSINIVTLAFVGHLGKQELAAAALATSLVGIVGRTVMYGMVGALDTLASQMVALPLHVANNYVLVYVLRLGYLGSAWATCLTAAYGLAGMLGYVAWTGLGGRLWRGPPVHSSIWKSWGFSLMTLAAGKLPDPGTAVAAASISFNLYGILYMVFLAFSMTTSTAVGNALGSGSARAARHAALTSLVTAPAMWFIVATLLIEPHTQGAGKQRLGVLVNIVAFYVCAIPTALLLAFRLGWGVEGMYTGMLLGPAIQAVSYVYIIARLDWTAEARAVAARAAASSTAHVDAPRVAAAALPGAGQGRAQNDRENASAV